MKPLRVAYVVNVFPKLSETFIAHELAELKRRGVELCVLSLRQPTDELRHDIIAESGLDALTCYDPALFGKILRDFLNYMSSGPAQQMAGTIGYAPLPLPVVALVRARIKTLTAAGQRIR